MGHEYKITVLGDTESTFVLSLTEEELKGINKLSEKLVDISSVDIVSILVNKLK